MSASIYKQPRRRKAEFITPPNMLKEKVGDGGLSDEILIKAQDLLENNAVDFRPLGDMYLESLHNGVTYARRATKNGDDHEALIATMLYPAMQLKANGGMFHYPLITRVADKLIQFLEVIEHPDAEVLEIVEAFHTSIRAILHGQVKGEAGRYGDELEKALMDACFRYFEKFPGNKTDLPN